MALTEPPLRLSKPAFDVAIFTNRLAPMLAFWQDTAGAQLEETQRIRDGYTQYRHKIGDTFIKLGHMEAALPDNPAGGLRELIIARPDCRRASHHADPDGNLLSIVPPGTYGVDGVAIRIHVRSVSASTQFFRDVVGLPVEHVDGETSIAVGASRLLLREDPSVSPDAPLQGPGLRFLTLPVFDARGLYAAMLARGARDGMPPKRLGDTARYAFVRDADGNWLELSQRASLTGPIGSDD